MSRQAERRKAQYETEYDAPRRGSGTKQLIILLAVAFVVTLGVMIGARLSSDAIAVLVGVIAGVAASIPCALLLMAVTRRRHEDYETPHLRQPDRYGPQAEVHDPRPTAPPVIVITPGSSPQQLGSWANGPGHWDSSQESWHTAPGYKAPGHSQRQFRVMGYDEDQEDE